MGDFGAGVVAIITGIIGLAIVAVVVSTRANTQNVIGAAGGALTSVINAAVSPVGTASGVGIGT